MQTFEKSEDIASLVSGRWSIVVCKSSFLYLLTPGFRYQEFGPEFRAEFFNATEWANLVAESGRPNKDDFLLKYLNRCLTSVIGLNFLSSNRKHRFGDIALS